MSETIKRKRGRPKKVVVETAPSDDEVIICPKCGLDDPGDWNQCKGSCPMPESPHYKQGNRATLPLVVNGKYNLVGYTWTILSFTGDHFLKASRSPHGIVHHLARSDFENWIKELR